MARFAVVHIRSRGTAFTTGCLVPIRREVGRQIHRVAMEDRVE